MRAIIRNLRRRVTEWRRRGRYRPERHYMRGGRPATVEERTRSAAPLAGHGRALAGEGSPAEAELPAAVG